MSTSPVIALEIGTTKVVALVGEMREDGRVIVIGMGEHASNLGSLIAHEIAQMYPGTIALIADPVVTDEMDDIAMKVAVRFACRAATRSSPVPAGGLPPGPAGPGCTPRPSTSAAKRSQRARSDTSKPR